MNANRTATAGAFVGTSVLRQENHALLTGRGQFMDDLPVKTGTLHAAILRSPHPHAEIAGIDISKCVESPGVHAVITGADVAASIGPLKTPIDTPMRYYGIAVDRVRFVGEPMAVVCAEDRYRAEDALDLIKVDYRPLPAVVDPNQALSDRAEVIHPEVGSNLYSRHHFVHGDPDEGMAAADHTIDFTVRYPRHSIPPIECFVCVAEHLPATGGYDVVSNFPGPFGMHAVMAWALGVPGNRLRLRSPPNAGGNFGVKLTMFPQLVVMCVAARVSGRPVKWVEDRLEHLTAANSAPNRVTRVHAGYTAAGEVTAIRFEHWDDHGAYLRAPMPAPIFRMHGVTSSAYKVRNLDVAMNIVATNKCPTGAVRGFGGPQLFFAVERLMQRIAVELGLDPLEVIRRNLLPPDVFPYRAPAGAVYDSGNYQRTVDEAVDDGGLAELRVRRDEARASGRYYGIGYAVGIEPSQSNMGYIAITKPPEKWIRGTAKDGAIVYATVAVDSTGSVSVKADSVPQGQGHATVLSQIVADQLGLAPEDISVNLELDTDRDAWSIASGNYSSRFAPAVGGAVHLAAGRVREKLIDIARGQLNVPAERLTFADGQIIDRENPDNALAFRRAAALAHWSPGSLPDGMEPGIRERVAWSAPELSAANRNGEVNCELAYGFIFDYCGVEIDPTTFNIRIDRYVTAHDSGTVLNPALVEGQIGGSFAAGLGAALYEEFVYGADGTFFSGTFADYLVPTSAEVPSLRIVHATPSPSPVTPLGAKGVGEGNTYTTPACIANAVADALDLADVELPITPSKLADLVQSPEPEPPTSGAPQFSGASDRMLSGRGTARVSAPPDEVWKTLLDPVALRGVIPGCRTLEARADDRYHAEVDIGVGPVRGRFTATVRLTDMDPPRAVTLSGEVFGPLGCGAGTGRVTLESDSGRDTTVSYTYEAQVSGKMAAVGGRMLESAARTLIGQFFRALASQSVDGKATMSGWLAWLQRLFRGHR